ncbi:hypothetical protein ACS0TY_031976 [Phlomoides rotata]
MKSRVRNSGIESPPSFHKYLKPGELAQLRYSKITARSKQIGAQMLLALRQLESTSGSVFAPPHLTMDGPPCFNLRVKGYPRCFQRKKLLAVTPFFSETQS